MKHLITIQTVKQADPFSEAAEEFEDVGEEMFSLEPLTGEEKEHAEAMQSRVSLIGICHYFADAHPAMRLKHGSRIFHVESVINQHERFRFLVWQLVEVV